MSYNPVPKRRNPWKIGCLALIVVAVLFLGGCGILVAVIGGGDNDTNSSETTATQETTETPAPTREAPTPEVPAEEPAVSVPAEPAPTVESDPAEAAAPAGTTAPDDGPNAGGVPTEYTSALRSAESYLSFMPMSKAGLYDQLTSEYGDQFSAEAAQYAVDNVDTDWNENALKSARSYQDDMHMSPEGIRDQLTSEYGEQFTQEQADYAVSNL